MKRLGDLHLMATVPVRMWKALAVIAARAHQAYDECSGIAAGGSHDKCLFMSLVVRDFLVGIGYRDATVRSCFLYVATDEADEKNTWSVGIGAPGQVETPGKFNGHAVCVVPSLDLLIDTTMYQAIRPQWCDTVSGMAAVQYHEPRSNQRINDCPAIAGVEVALPDRRVTIAWLDRPEVQWKREPDFRQKNHRRRFVTKALSEAFGEFA